VSLTLHISKIILKLNRIRHSCKENMECNFLALHRHLDYGWVRYIRGLQELKFLPTLRGQKRLQCSYT